MALDPTLAAMLAAGSDASQPPASFTERRTRFAEELGAIDQPGPVMAEEQALSIGVMGPLLEARLFRPWTAADPRSTMLFFHGGGWIQGSVATHASICRHLAHYGRFDILSVDYRLAPEHPYPAAVNDAVDALCWLTGEQARAQIDPGRIWIGGDSAGGNLAAAACLAARTSKIPPPEGALLLYPALDLSGRAPSRDLFVKGFWLDTLDELIGYYAPDPATRTAWTASPIASESLEGFPSTMLVTAGYDPLRDEGIDFAARLMRNGVTCTLRNESTMIHGFLSLHGIVPAARHLLIDIAESFGIFIADKRPAR